jgi:hypothetical protein
MRGVFDGRRAHGHYRGMTQAPEPQIPPRPVGPPPPPLAHVARPSRLYQAAAWVVIVAGIVFVVAVIFFSGATFAWHHQRYHHPGMFGPGGPDETFVFPGGSFPPGMGPGWPGGPPMMPGPFGPGMGPGGHGGGHGGPGQLPPPAP